MNKRLKMNSILKCLLGLFAVLVAGSSFALDNEGWLAKARECAEAGQFLDSDETNEEGVYCIVLAAISAAEGKTVQQKVGEAELEAKRKLTAYVQGETVTSSRSVESRSATVTAEGEKTAKSFSKFQKRIESKVDAFVRGTKVIGQVTVKETSYVVCVTTERFEDDSTILKAAQAEYGDEGVVMSVGEAESLELATQKAIRGAIEQVLGTVVVGYDKMSSKSEFQHKVFSGADGVVEKYRVLSETEIEVGKRVEIVAKVSKKSLLDNYSNYMKFLGNPAFYIESNSDDLQSHFTQFFTDIGIRIAPDPNQAAYVIHCIGVFREVEHPINGRHGIQLSLRFKISEINGTEVLVDMKNDPRKSASFVGKDPDRQKELCSGKAFDQMKKPLHEKIQDMVGKLVGRKMDEAARAD